MNIWEVSSIAYRGTQNPLWCWGQNWVCPNARYMMNPCTLKGLCSFLIALTVVRSILSVAVWSSISVKNQRRDMKEWSPCFSALRPGFETCQWSQVLLGDPKPWAFNGRPYICVYTRMHTQWASIAAAPHTCIESKQLNGECSDRVVVTQYIQSKIQQTKDPDVCPMVKVWLTHICEATNFLLGTTPHHHIQSQTLAVTAATTIKV